MGNNTFGHALQFTSFGESHGPAMGVVLQGCPAGLEMDLELLRLQLQRRRPGQSNVVTDRNEKEDFDILSGVHEGKTLGTPICIVVRNKDARSGDYKDIEKQLNESSAEKSSSTRKGHADDVWRDKFGHSDVRGGGRASGRETLSRVIAGSIAQMLLRKWSPETNVFSFTDQIFDFKVSEGDIQKLLGSQDHLKSSLRNNSNKFPVDSNSLRMPNNEMAEEVASLLKKAKEEGKSYGGAARVIVHAPPKNLGQPVFNKIKSELANAYMTIGATTGVELGSGFQSVIAEGSEFHSGDANVYGGIRGGITTGEKLDFRVAFKPTSSVIDVAKKGRHDPCIVPRAVVVLEAMTHFVLADQILMQRLDRV